MICKTSIKLISIYFKKLNQIESYMLNSKDYGGFITANQSI